MDKILGAQKIKMCEPNGMKDLIVVMYDDDYLICYDINASWIKIKDGPKNYGYTFFNLQRENYNINWNVSEVQYLNKESINKISLSYFPMNWTPVILELLGIEYTDEKKILKILIKEQIIYNYEDKEFNVLGQSISIITFCKKNREYIYENIVDLE